jgi:hypothetical protein
MSTTSQLGSEKKQMKLRMMTKKTNGKLRRAWRKQKKKQ